MKVKSNDSDNKLTRILNKSETRKGYRDLSKSARYLVENEIMDKVLTAVIPAVLFKKNGNAYIEENKEKIAIDISSLVDNCKVRLEKLIKYDIILKFSHFILQKNS